MKILISGLGAAVRSSKTALGGHLAGCTSAKTPLSGAAGVSARDPKAKWFTLVIPGWGPVSSNPEAGPRLEPI